MRPWDEVPDGMKDVVERVVKSIKSLEVDKIKLTSVTQNITAHGEQETDMGFVAVTDYGVYEFRVCEKKVRRPLMPIEVLGRFEVTDIMEDEEEPKPKKYKRKAKKKAKKKPRKTMDFLGELKKI